MRLDGKAIRICARALLAIVPGTLLSILTGACRATEPTAAGLTIDPTAPSRQLIIVRTPSWESPTGTLTRYERARPGEKWTQSGEPCEVNVGRTGLAWGKGLHGGALGDGPEKFEGDGKSPAGVFRLSAVYGYASRDSVPYLRMPYIEATSTCQCVDDVRSRYYNLVLDSLSVLDADWASRERMRPPKGDWNRWGVIVDHNMSPREPGRGSCIFLHVTEGTGVPTSGCTSLDEDRIVAIARWLDPESHPVLVQLTSSWYHQLKPSWRLP